jgi:hypothetical protein
MPARPMTGRRRSATASALLIVAATLTCGARSTQEPELLRDPKTRELFASARIAIFGGPGGVARLRALRFKGRSRFAGTGSELLSAAVEIRVLLPDRYLRIDTGSFGRRQSGYAGGQTLDRIEDATGLVTPDPRSVAMRLRTDRAELARLLLGVAMYASEDVPMKLQTRDTPTEMPGLPEPLGIDATGDTFTARIAFDGKSHLPVRLVFWSGDRVALTTAFADRRSAGGMQVPYSMITTAGADRVVDELLFDEVAVNPPLTKADFSR